MLRNLVSGFIVLLLVGLVACGGSEERQAKYYERAQSAFDAGEFDKARIDAQNVLQINPKHAQARYLMALLSERKQDWKGMYGNLAAAVDADPAMVPARMPPSRQTT